MKQISLILLSGAALALAGCASTPKTALLAPIVPPPGGHENASGDGFLRVYSARERAITDLNAEEFFWNNDFGRNEFLHLPAHTGYTIYDQEGRLYKRVRNAQSVFDAEPALVRLPPGTYQVEAQALDHDAVTYWVTVPVVIDPAQTTAAHLDGGWEPSRPYAGTEVVYLPNGRIAGWSASASDRPTP